MKVCRRLNGSTSPSLSALQPQIHWAAPKALLITRPNHPVKEYQKRWDLPSCMLSLTANIIDYDTGDKSLDLHIFGLTSERANKNLQPWPAV